MLRDPSQSPQPPSIPMKPKRIILVRHGESEGNLDKAIYADKPDYALLLTETGMKQASNAGAELKRIIGDEKVKFFISPHFRTRMTFEGITPHFSREQVTYVEEPRLREQEWGHFRNENDGKEVDRQRDEFGTFYFRIPDGESAADVYDRVSDFFGTMHREFLKPNFPENVIIVTHGMTIRLFLMRWFHWTVEEFERYHNPENCQIITMEKDGSDKYRLISELANEPSKNKHQRPVNPRFSDSK